MKKQMGMVPLASIVINELINLQDFFNVTVKMNPAQIAETAEIILEKFYFMRLDEIKLCFRRAKAGDYGELYNRLDGSVIIGWLNLYDRQRSEVVVKANKNLAASTVYDELAHHQVIGAAKEVYSALRMKEVNRIMSEPFIKEVRPREEILMEQWMSEFNSLYNSTTVDKSNPTRMIYYEGGWLDQQQYLLLKAKEYEESNKNQE
jgi:hypothetical protein